MNENWQTLQTIARATQDLEPSRSVDSQQFSRNLQTAIQPCLDEITQSCRRLDNLLAPCFAECDRAEDIWESKSRVLAVSSVEIWEQLGELSGQIGRVKVLQEKLKQEILKKVTRFFDEEVESAKKQWFEWNHKSRKFDKTSVGMFEKTRFFDACTSQLIPVVEFALSTLVDGLASSFDEISLLKSATLKQCLDAMDKQERDKFIADILTRRYVQVVNPKNWLNDQAFSERILKHGQVLYQERILWIFIHDYDKVCELTFSEIEAFICETVEEQAAILIEKMEKNMAFYNDFLEKQQRYQQETPQQREQEKALIMQQRQRLEQVKGNLEAIALGSS